MSDLNESSQANVDTGAGAGTGFAGVGTGFAGAGEESEAKTNAGGTPALQGGGQNAETGSGQGNGEGTDATGTQQGTQQRDEESPDSESVWSEYAGKFVPEVYGDSGVELVSKADVEGFVPVARKLGLSTVQADSLISFVKELNRGGVERMIGERNERIGKYEAALRADKEFGGADGSKFDENLKLAAQGMRRLFGNNPEVITALTDSWLGSHPDIVKGCWRVGIMEKEGSVVGGVGSVTGGKDFLKQMYDASEHA